MSTELVEIYFRDLEPDAQEKVLAFFGAERARDLGLLDSPLFVLDGKFKVEIISRLIGHELELSGRGSSWLR